MGKLMLAAYLECTLKVRDNNCGCGSDGVKGWGWGWWGGVSMLMVWVLLPESGLNPNVAYIFL